MTSSKEMPDRVMQNKSEKTLYVFSRGDNYLAQDSLGQIVYVKGRTKAEAALKEIKALVGSHIVSFAPLAFRLKSKNK